MKKAYDFKDAKRGAVLAPPPGKTRITIRIDDDLLDWFKKRVHEAGGGSYQTMINDALRTYVEEQHEPLEETLRRVILEVVPGAKKPGKRKAPAKKKAAQKKRT